MKPIGNFSMNMAIVFLKLPLEKDSKSKEAKTCTNPNVPNNCKESNLSSINNYCKKMGRGWLSEIQ